MYLYIETVHLLDLCILSYQLHAQTLVWPVDPYYEFSTSETRRKSFMDLLRDHWRKERTLYGPGSCQGDEEQGWGTNDFLDPVFSRYTRLYPWRPSFTRPNGRDEPWVAYDTPQAITRRIGKVCMVRYGSSNFGPYSRDPRLEVNVIHKDHPKPDPQAPARDVLYCFEGGTGAVYGDGTPKRYASWSMMGFVLASEVPRTPPVANEYDVFIVFRGSRSGNALAPQRVKAQLLDTTGNPDWVTDFQVLTVAQDSEISPLGSCSKGFMASLKSMFPTVMRCLESVHEEKRKAPRTIIVTGHSLGAALACQFTSAMLLGSKYGNSGQGNSMPHDLRLWPWDHVRLVTFGAPPVGGKTFRDSFDFACPSTRVWVDGDPVTKEVPNNLLRVGSSSIELKPARKLIAGLNPHDPLAIRISLVDWISTNMTPLIFQEIPMSKAGEQPWKLFTSTKALLKYLADWLAANLPEAASQLVPDCEGFLLPLLEVLKRAYPDMPDMTKEIDTLLNAFLAIARGTDVHGQNYTPFMKLQSLINTCGVCTSLAKGHKAIYDLVRLSILFNALSQDSNLYRDGSQFKKITDLYGLEDLKNGTL